MITEELKKEIVKCAQANGLGFYSWGGTLPKGSIDYKQIDGDTLGVQIFTPDSKGYKAYEKIKDELSTLMAQSNLHLINEIDFKPNRGWHKELHYKKGGNSDMDKVKIFIVHGHDNEMKETVARFIEKLDFDAIILHEQANKGQTVIEKLESNTQDVPFAIILYSPDDEMKDGKKRARQNVVFEHGLLIGKLTRAKVVAIYKSDNDIETLSDLSGVIYIKYESGWKTEVAKEIKAAGLTFNTNKLI